MHTLDYMLNNLSNRKKARKCPTLYLVDHSGIYWSQIYDDLVFGMQPQEKARQQTSPYNAKIF
jgi:hypothetical protein